MMTFALYWFRRDLRLSDNPALSAAVSSYGKVMPVALSNAPTILTAADWWRSKSIAALSQDLSANYRVQMLHNVGHATTILPAIAKALKVSAVCWTKGTTPDEVAEDSALKAALEDAGITASPFQGNSIMHQPDTLLKGDGTPYKVFTPFYKQWLPQMENLLERPLQRPEKGSFVVPETNSGIGGYELPKQPHWATSIDAYWQDGTNGRPGENGAKARFATFLDEHLSDYKENRDMLGDTGTSQMSPSLCFGEISPRQMIYAAKMADPQNSKSEAFIRQLAWRDFAAYTLHHNPNSATRSMKPHFDNTMWRTDQQADQDFDAWCQGETGQELVDAAMKQLWQTGIMHNRARMVVASYLTKNLGIAWQRGAEWFLQTLVDADPANNALGWQWVAGCGTDAAPYFRIFNPETQAAKFDPQADYRRRWLGDDFEFRNIAPLVCLKQSRADALSRYDDMRET